MYDRLSSHCAVFRRCLFGGLRVHSAQKGFVVPQRSKATPACSIVRPKPIMSFEEARWRSQIRILLDVEVMIDSRPPLYIFAVVVLSFCLLSNSQRHEAYCRQSTCRPRKARSARRQSGSKTRRKRKSKVIDTLPTTCDDC